MRYVPKIPTQTQLFLFYLLTQVCNAALPVSLHQNVAALQVSMCDGWFALRTEDLCVEVHKAAGDGQAHAQTALWVQYVALQEVIEGAQLMEVCDQPQLSAGVFRCHV